MRKRENWLPALILIFAYCPAAILADGWVSTDSASQYGFSNARYPGEDSPPPPSYTFSVAPDPSRHDMFLYDYANNGQAGQPATDVVQDRRMRWTAEQIRTFNSHYDWNYVHQVLVDRNMYEADSYISTNLHGVDHSDHNEDEDEWEEDYDGYEEKEVGTLFPEFLNSNTDYYVHTHWKQLANGAGQFESQAELTEPGFTDVWHPRGQRSLGRMGYSVSNHSPSSVIWDFDTANNFEGWVPFKTSGAAVNNGILFIDPAGHDPYVEGPAIQASATYYKYVMLDMASNAQDGYGRIYFKTQSSNFYSDDKSVPFTVKHCPPSSCNGGAQFRDYTVDMAVNSKWAGTVTGIRVDPANDGRAGTNIDTIGFDSIRLSRHYYADSGEVDFELVTEQQSQTVTQGGVAQFRIRADFSDHFYGQVQDFVVLNPPPGTSARFDPPTISTSGGSTTLSLETSGSTPIGTSSLVVSAGNSNQSSSLVNLELTVNPPSAQVVNIIPNVRLNGQSWSGWIWLRVTGPQGVVVDRQVLVPSEAFAVPPGSYTIQYISGGPASASLSQVWAAQPCGATGATGVSCNYTSASLNNGVFFDFSGSGPATYSIGGRVTDNTGAGIGDVQVSVSGTEIWYTRTTPSGNYNFYGLKSGGGYTVAPSGSNYNFNPQAVTFNNLTADATANFTGILRASPAGRIAFTRGYNENAEIWVINADGSGLTQLTHNSANDAYPTWSPDGTKIAFVSWRDGNKEIYVMNADGSNQRNLTNHYEYDLDPAWSPDGSRIAFHSYRDGNAEIYVMKADGSSPSRLTYSAQTIDSEAAWSPDGTKIVFQRFENYIVDIYTVNADGTNLRNLTNNPGQSSAPAWSPGGDKIAFSRDGEIFVMKPDGTGQTNLTRNPAGDSNPSWSPDGSAITFISYRENQQDLYVMSADGSNQMRLTYTPDDDYDPAWQQRPGPEMISVTVQSSPPGRSVTVDSVSYTAPQTFSWAPGTAHTIGTTATQDGTAGTRYVWEGWGDGGTVSHSVSPTASTSYTANFSTQHLLTMSAGPGGSVSPASSWFNSGQGVTISATPNSGFIFSGWSGTGTGSFTGTSNPASLTMNGPVTQSASFTATTTPTPTPTPTNLTNLAHNKPAAQSSDPFDAPAGRAVDGNASGDWSNNSITHTNLDPQAWWQVDLGSVQSINDVKVFNRTDCCSERLSDFYVLVSDWPFASTDLTVTLNQAGVSGYRIVGPAGPQANVAVGRTGRYVRVQLTATNYLSLAEVQVWGTLSLLTNLAHNKPAAQSSDPFGAPPARATDGNTSGEWSAGSTTHTNLDAQAWWQVDLGSVQSINEIKIINRTDCCGERLSDFYVFVSDSPLTSTDLTTTLNQAGVSRYHKAGPAGAQANFVVARSGRYVRVQLTGTNYLSLAEVQVWGTSSLQTNLALGRAAAQSSDPFGAPPARATDGNTSGEWSAGSTTHTNLDAQAWWQVDLGSVQSIQSVKVWNRTDCCADRLSNFYVLISDVPFASTDLTATRNQAGVSSFITPGVGGTPTAMSVNRTGRYVRVQLSGTNYLALAEVQVFGGAHTPTHLAQGKPATQSSDPFGGPAARAADGNTSGDWSNNSVTHTNNDTQAWWQVDLGSVQSIATVRVWNRTDCCGSRLNNFHVLVSDVPFTSTDLTTTLNQAGVSSHFTAGVAGAVVEINVDRTGRYVRVQLSGTGYLSLAEVQVWAPVSRPNAMETDGVNESASMRLPLASTKGTLHRTWGGFELEHRLLHSTARFSSKENHREHGFPQEEAEVSGVITP